jgi:hypothetical protein
VLQLYSFDSSYSLVVLEERDGGIREGQIFKAKMNKYKINNNNNKTNTKHEFNVKYERYKQDISKDRKLCLGKKL